MVDAMSVRTSDINRDALPRRLNKFPTPEIDRVFIGNANLMLGIFVYPVFTACVEAGLLSVDEDKICEQQSCEGHGEQSFSATPFVSRFVHHPRFLSPLFVASTFPSTREGFP